MCQESTRIPPAEDTEDVFYRETCDGRREIVLVGRDGREHPFAVKLRQTDEHKAAA